MEQPHDAIHLVCDVCGSVEDSDGVLTQLKSRLETAHGFDARSAEVTVFGRCTHCRDSP